MGLKRLWAVLEDYECFECGCHFTSFDGTDGVWIFRPKPLSWWQRLLGKKNYAAD
jgi:hypothetical protein